jgi:hypothetical protein
MRAVLERLLPADATGPGALGMNVDGYVLDGLAGPIGHLRGFCEDGLAALSVAAERLHGAPFDVIGPGAQDDVLERLERDEIEEIADGTGFFNLVHHLMLEGAFCDPRHGGNHSMAGWELLGFPGLRLEVSAAEQALDTTFEGPRRSIADFPELPRG